MSTINAFFEERLRKSQSHVERIELLNDPECPSWLIRTLCFEDAEAEVIQAAMSHPRCFASWRKRAEKRLNYMAGIRKYKESDLVKILTDHNHFTRAQLAEDIDCPLDVLQSFCEKEEIKDVVKAAVTNPFCKDEWVKIALYRFPSLESEGALVTRKRRLDAIIQMEEIAELEVEGSLLTKGDRDQIILDHIKKRDKLNHAESHLGVFEDTSELYYKNKEIQWADTNKCRVALVMAPSWGVLFPPYNLAKLTGMLRKHDYSVKVYDSNIRSFHFLQNTLGEDYWRSERYFLWTIKENFDKYLLPHLQDIFWDIIRDIVVSNPKVIGFSLYSTNKYAALYIMKEIRYLLPDVCIIVGGPEVATGGASKQFTDNNLINYVFVGEAEENLLFLLENLPTEYPILEEVGNTDSKIDLDTYAYPDYTDYVLSNYLHKDGVSIETSRGCVAQCSFCAETYFWKFRNMTPARVLEEMEYQMNTHDVSRFWFVDSLANGNIKSFRKLVDLINEKELGINWNSYARCDGRMDEEFILKIAQSGCTCLSFGVESGSQKVLHDMRKKIELWEIENNLRDSFNAGIFVHANWMIGFPTEEPIDQLHSWQLLYNCRKWIHAISPGFTAGPATASHMDTDWQVYGIQWKEQVWDNRFLNNWWTKDYQNTNLHRFIRLKLTHIWFEITKDHSGSIIINSQRYDKIKDFYNFAVKNNPKIEYIPPDEFVKLDRLDKLEFKNTIANEYFTIAYCLWIYYGACHFEFICDQTVDKEQFGNFLSNMYDCKLIFDIDETGEYTFTLEHTFQHDSPDAESAVLLQEERARLDQSFTMSYYDSGNIHNWVSPEKQTKETVHEQYRNKKKVFQIIQETITNE